jgi:hypothetical protein
MALHTPPAAGPLRQWPIEAEVIRQIVQALSPYSVVEGQINAGTYSYGGVVGSTDFLVQPTYPLSLGVNIFPGMAFVQGWNDNVPSDQWTTFNPDYTLGGWIPLAAGYYTFLNDANPVVVPIPPNATGSTVYYWLTLVAFDAQFMNTATPSQDFQSGFYLIPCSNNTIPNGNLFIETYFTYDFYTAKPNAIGGIPLALIAVPNGATTIVAADLTDTRMSVLGNPFRAKAYRAASGAVAASGKIIYDHVAYDPDNDFNGYFDGWYRCPVDGYYRVNFSVQATASSYPGFITLCHGNVSGGVIEDIQNASFASAGATANGGGLIKARYLDTIFVTSLTGLTVSAGGQHTTNLTVEYVGPFYNAGVGQ